MELIPGLPNDVARECLIRLPFETFPAAVSVSKEWSSEIELPEYSLRRRVAGFSEVAIVMAKAKVDPNRKFDAIAKFAVNPVYRLVLCEPETGSWCELPGSEGLPMFCQIVGVGSDLVVMGGWVPETWAVSRRVRIYNFVTATWRHGADMPGCKRSFFGCVTDSDKKVYVAGGHDEEKTALRSVMAYDVSKDEWSELPDMINERDECKAIFNRGKLHVIGGYQSDMQGRFHKSVETFHFETSQWDHGDDFLEKSMCPRTCVANSRDGKVYMIRDDRVWALKENKWHSVAELPMDVRNVSNVSSWHREILLMGSPRFSEPETACLLNLTSYTWRKVNVPKEYSGHSQTGCCLEI